MSAAVIARRRVRLAVIVAVCCGLVATGVAGVGLLLPSGDGGGAVRLLAAAVALASGAVLVRIDGAARGVTTLASVSVVAVLVCLATLPASPVSPVSLTKGAETTDEETPSDGGSGLLPDVLLDPGDAGEQASPLDPVGLPEGADVTVEAGEVILTTPDGARIVLGQAGLEGHDPGIPDGGTDLVVVDGVVGRGDGGEVGGDLALGGTTFERSDGSRVTVGDGGLLDVPPPVETEPDEPEPLDAVLAVLLGLFALVAFAPPIVRFGERAPVALVDDDSDDPGDVVAGTPQITMEEGLAEVLRSMLADPDPRTSVIGAYARLLTALAEAGHPRRAEEGPHEHLWRTLGPLGVRRQPVHRLAELFVRARFTPRPVTEQDRHAAIGALADAVADLRLQATDVSEAAAAAGVST